MLEPSVVNVSCNQDEDKLGPKHKKYRTNYRPPEMYWTSKLRHRFSLLQWAAQPWNTMWFLFHGAWLLSGGRAQSQHLSLCVSRSTTANVAVPKELHAESADICWRFCRARFSALCYLTHQSTEPGTTQLSVHPVWYNEFRDAREALLELAQV